MHFRPMRLVVKRYQWVHVTLGLIGNLSFFIGSVLFFWESWKNVGIWLFVIGSLGMLIDTIGSAIEKYEKEPHHGR